MNLIPMRTAVIAGTCAIALSFVAVPAFAAPTSISGTSCVTDQNDPSYDSTCLDTPDPTVTDDTTADTTDDSSADDSSADDPSSMGDDTSADDPSADDGTPVETAAPLPAELGKPKQAFAATVFAPSVIAKKGITVHYTGLTAGASYQPFYSTGQSGGELGKLRTANGKGAISFTYKFSKSEKKQLAKLGAVYTIGILGQDTDLRLTKQITVKYDSDLTWHAADRHGKKVTLSVSVDRAGASGEDSDWSRAKVAFQKKVGTAWVTVKTVKTDSDGDAKATFRAKVNVWRAVVKSGTTVFGSTSKGHRA